MNCGNPQVFIIVSGIPASGKSTLGRKLAAALQLPCYDKDDILERLFDGEGIGDAAWRRQLSRQSDEELVRQAMASTGAVVISFWRTEKTGKESGTPVEWIRNLPGRIYEIHCVCDPLVTAGRFKARRRHAGHLDNGRPTADPEEFRFLASAGPLGLGELRVVDTSGAYDIESIAAGIRASLDG